MKFLNMLRFLLGEPTMFILMTKSYCQTSIGFDIYTYIYKHIYIYIYIYIYTPIYIFRLSSICDTDQNVFFIDQR